MVAIVRTAWDGTSGGPGLTQFAALGGSSFTAGTAQSLVNATRAFWASLATILPDEVRLTVLPTVDIYDDATGELTGSYVAPTAPSVMPGTQTGGYAGGSGFKVNWNTGAIRNGRRVRGATFIVPASNSIFTATGTVGGAFITSTNTAAQNMLAAFSSAGAPMVVWSRPLIKDDVIVRTGASTGVVSASTGAKSAILRGRRD